MRTLFSILIVAATTATAIDIDQWQDLDFTLQSEAAAKQARAEKLLLADTHMTENQELYDAVYYRLELFPDVSSKVLYGNVSMQARALQSNLDRADLNLLNNIQVDSVFYNENPAVFEHADDILTVYFDAPVNENQLFTTRVVYHGKPAQSGFGAFDFSSHNGKPMIWTLSEPYGARNWWPCKDIPADKADSMDIIVTVREDLIVASNGSLRSVVESDGKKTWWWHEQYPMVTYLASLAIHPYYTYSDWYVNADNDSMEVQFYVFPDAVADARENNAKTVPMIKAFAELFGEYPFIEEKYGHAQFLWGGGMEHQTISSLGGFGEGLIAHELAHQWWGDMVTCEDFHHIWLNEGFATYSEAMWWEYKYGGDALTQRMSYNTYFGDETIYVEDPFSENIFFFPTTYKKASWVLHMLRHVVGDDVFFRILRTYYKEFKFKTATTEQFRDLCERASGKELDLFFDQWIYQSGAPYYQWLWQKQPKEGGGWRVSGFIKQVQQFGPIFHMPIDLTVYTNSGEQTFVINNTKQSQAFEFVVADEPVNVELDKDHWILKQVEQITTPEFVVQEIMLTSEDGTEKTVFAPGERGRLAFRAQNRRVTALDVQAFLQTADPFIDIVKASGAFGVVTTGDSIDNLDDPFVFNIAENAPSHLAQLDLAFKSAAGETQVIPLQLPIGEPTLLIVDDDGGADYEKYYWDMALQKNVFAELWSIDEQGDVDAGTLQNYGAVLWFTGDAVDSTLTPNDQTALRQYLAQGGRLLLTGQNIAADLAGSADEGDSVFLANVLHAAFVKDAAEDESVIGVPGDPVGDRLAMRFNDAYPMADNQDSKDVILPLHSAAPCFLYLPGNQPAGLRFADPENGSKIVYLGFGLEGVAGPRPSTATDVLEKILLWFELPSGIDSYGTGSAPFDFVLQQNFPNPFNPMTTIRFYAPENGQIQADIYNVRGRRIRSLESGAVTGGWHFLVWDGRDDGAGDAASGVYFLQIHYNNENISASKSVKMLKIE